MLCNTGFCNQFLKLFQFGSPLDSCKRAVEKNNIFEAYKQVSGYSASLWGDNQPEGVPRWSGLTGEEVSDYLVTNQKLMLENIKKEDRKSRDVAMLPLMPQFRTGF